MRNQTVAVFSTVELVTETCCNCGVLFGMTPQFKRSRTEHPGGDAKGGNSFYCPNGHKQHYTGPTEAELARRRAEQAERALANRDEDLRSERASHSATKGQLTKVRKRIANGVCPCCHRTFQQLSRHMASKHPDFAQETG